MLQRHPHRNSAQTTITGVPFDRLRLPSRLSGGRSSRILRHASSGDDFRKTLEWARTQFALRVASEVPEVSLQPGLLSLLIAIEDAAAAELLHESNPSLLQQAVFRFLRDKAPELYRKAAYEDLGFSEMPVLGEMGMPSTWNLERLDSLAQEAASSLRNNLLAGAALLPGGESTSDGQDYQALARAYPMLAIAAVNEVLFAQHGYQGQPAKQDPRQYQLPWVLEHGGGAPAVLTILYTEVCSRLGLPLEATILEKGHYAVLWPKEGPLLLAGQEVVIDVYSEGALFLVSEVRQLFDLGPEPLPIATKRETICALLCGLRHFHWCKAVGCRTERALTIPLSLKTALTGAVGSRRGYQIERAIAAAERCCLLLPDDRDHRASLALLLYYVGRKEEALEVIADDEDGQELQQFKTLLRMDIAYQKL